MERFLTGYTPPPPKKRKTSEEKLVSQRKYEKDSRVRSYLPKWETEFPWLKHLEGKGMTCAICVAFDTCTTGPFITGCNNYKKDTIMNHERSESHRQNVDRQRVKNGNLSDTPAVKLLKQLNDQTVKQLDHKFRNVHFLGRKGRPFTDYPLLCSLDEAKGLDVGSNYRSDKSAVQFSECIATAERQRICNEIKQVKFVSGISDGSTDSSFQETEIVYVRYAHSEKISVHFSFVKNIPKGDAASIADVIMKGLENLAGEEYGKKLVATGTDGASTMLGAKTGAVQRIRETLKKPWIVGVHCNGHKLELAYKDAIKSGIKLYSKIEVFLLNIYYFYRNSNLTRAGLKDSFKVLNQRVILPTRVGGTRWIGHLLKAVEHFLRGYEAIRQHLQQLQNRDLPVSRTDKGNKAKHFLSVASSRDVWLMMNFLLDVLSILTDISKKFQSKTTTISEVLDEIRFGVKNLSKLKTSDGSNLRKARDCEPPDLIGNDIAFSSARVKLLDALVQGLQKRFMDKLEILEACSVVNLSKFPTSDEDLSDYGDADIRTLADYFHDGLQDAGVDPTKCETEWTKLKDQISKRFSEPHSTTWEHVNEKLGQLCPNILSLVDLILTIPASSADAERGFNRLKLTKSDWRSKLTDHSLSDQLMIMLESCDIDQFDPMPAITHWMSGATRRLRQEKVTKSVECRTEMETPRPEVQSVVATTAPSMDSESVLPPTIAIVEKSVECRTEMETPRPEVQSVVATTAPSMDSESVLPPTIAIVEKFPEVTNQGTMTDPTYFTDVKYRSEADEEAYTSDCDYNEEDLDSETKTLKDRRQAASDAWQILCGLNPIV